LGEAFNINDFTKFTPNIKEIFCRVLEILPDVQLRYLHYPAFLTNCTATALSAYLHYIEP
jgi:hypothetical protein